MAILTKFKTGYYYLTNNGEVVYIIQDFTEETYCIVKFIHKNKRDHCSKDYLKANVIKELGASESVAHLLYGDSSKGVTYDKIANNSVTTYKRTSSGKNSGD